MYVIQNGPDWWIDQVARYPVGQVQWRGRSGAMGETTQANPLHSDQSTVSINSVTSDIEEEGEVGDYHETQVHNDWIIDHTAQDLKSNKFNDAASEQIVAAVAKNIAVIEQAMRQHQQDGTGRFDDEESDLAAADSDFLKTLKQDMLHNPSSVFAATQPNEDRAGLFSLLKA